MCTLSHWGLDLWRPYSVREEETPDEKEESNKEGEEAMRKKTSKERNITQKAERQKEENSRRERDERFSFCHTLTMFIRTSCVVSLLQEML